MKLCTEWYQDLGYAGEEAISLPTGRQASTCRRRSGYAQAGQITINIQIPISNDQRICFEFWSFGDWRLFGIWDLDFGIFPPRRDLAPATRG
jgi:hypothetical protein